MGGCSHVRLFRAREVIPHEPTTPSWSAHARCVSSDKNDLRHQWHAASIEHEPHVVARGARGRACRRRHGDRRRSCSGEGKRHRALILVVGVRDGAERARKRSSAVSRPGCYLAIASRRIYLGLEARRCHVRLCMKLCMVITQLYAARSMALKAQDVAYSWYRKWYRTTRSFLSVACRTTPDRYC
jgi:hypothetical protein